MTAITAFALQFQTTSYAQQTENEMVIEQQIEQEEVQTADATNNLAGRKFILLGDSYGDGWTPERMEVSWMARIKNALGSNNVYTCSEGGVGFCGYNSQRATYITLLQRLLPSIPDRNAITDIVPCGGLPDMRKTDEELIAGINNFVAYCRAMFPNAKISYGAIGWGPTPYIQNFMIPKYNSIYRNLGAFGIYNMEPAYNALHGHPEWFSSDGNHPNGAGQQAIADSIIGYLSSTRYLVGPTYTGLAQYPIDGQWYYATNGIQDTSYTGLVNYYGSWYYVQNGVLNWNYTGLVYYQNCWYYIENGVLNWNYTGFTEYYGTTYYVTNGVLVWGTNGAVEVNGTIYCLANSTLNQSYTGLCMSADKNWYYVKNGVHDSSFTGLVEHQGLQYYVQNGHINWGVNGLVQINGTCYYLSNSAVATWISGYKQQNGIWLRINKGILDTSYTGLFYADGAWRYMKNGRENNDYICLCDYNGQTYFVYYGRVAWTITDIWYIQDDQKLYLITGGVVDRNYNGLFRSSIGNNDWYYVQNGVVNTTYTGLVQNNGDWYYVQNGKIDWTFNGWTEYNGSHYYVTNGYLDWNKQPAE